MRYTEIDGKKYDIRCCQKCPFFYNGAYRDCNHPEWGISKRMTIGLFETNKRCDEGCPLRERMTNGDDRMGKTSEDDRMGKTSEDDRIISFVHRHTCMGNRRGCMSLFIDGRRFDLTLEEARHIHDELGRAIEFESCLEEFREKTRDLWENADTAEIMRALSEQKGI